MAGWTAAITSPTVRTPANNDGTSSTTTRCQRCPLPLWSRPPPTSCSIPPCDAGRKSRARINPTRRWRSGAANSSLAPERQLSGERPDDGAMLGERGVGRVADGWSRMRWEGKSNGVRGARVPVISLGERTRRRHFVGLRYSRIPLLSRHTHTHLEEQTCLTRFAWWRSV